MQIRAVYEAALEQHDASPASADPDGLLGDSQTLIIQMESLTTQMDRLSDIADSLEDAVLSVEGLKEADPHHLMLFEACLNMAQAGTVQSAENIQPGLENYLGTQISTEGVAQTIKNLLLAIQRLMRELWHRIVDIFVAIFNEVGRAKLRLQYVTTLVDEIDGKQPKREEVSLGNTAYGISTEAGAPTDARSIVVSLKELIHQTKVIREQAVPSLLTIGDAFARKLPYWPNDPAENSAWLKGLNAIASGFDPHSVAHSIGKAWPTHNPQFPAGSALVTSPLPGSRSLMFISGAKIYPDKVNGSEVDQAIMYQANAIVLSRQKQVSNNELGKATMSTLPNDHLQEIVVLVEKLLNEVETGVKAGLRSKLEKIGRDLEHSAARIDSETDVDVQRLRKGLRYASVFTGWVNSPYVQLMAHDLMVCRSMLSFVSRHCEAYHR